MEFCLPCDKIHKKGCLPYPKGDGCPVRKNEGLMDSDPGKSLADPTCLLAENLSIALMRSRGIEDALSIHP
jgi:hypothetical protein